MSPPHVPAPGGHVRAWRSRFGRALTGACVWGTMVVMVLIHRVPSILSEGCGRSTRSESWVGPWRSSSLGEGIPPPQARAPTPSLPGSGARGRVAPVDSSGHVRVRSRPPCTCVRPHARARGLPHAGMPVPGPWRAPGELRTIPVTLGCSRCPRSPCGPPCGPQGDRGMPIPGPTRAPGGLRGSIWTLSPPMPGRALLRPAWRAAGGGYELSRMLKQVFSGRLCIVCIVYTESERW